MTTIRFSITPAAWTKVTTGGGRKFLRKETEGEVLLHIGAEQPDPESEHFFAMTKYEEFELAGSDAVFARARYGQAQLVVIG